MAVGAEDDQVRSPSFRLLHDPITRRPLDDDGRHGEVRRPHAEFMHGGRHRVGGMLLLLIE
jgi:hypothetical protein